MAIWSPWLLTCAHASPSAFNAYVGIAVDVVCFFVALLSFRGISTPSLKAQGEQRRSSLSTFLGTTPHKGSLFRANQGVPVQCSLTVRDATSIAIAVVKPLADQLASPFCHDDGSSSASSPINRNRRLAKDFEATVASAETFLYAASVMMLTRRWARSK